MHMHIYIQDILLRDKVMQVLKDLILLVCSFEDDAALREKFTIRVDLTLFGMLMGKLHMKIKFNSHLLNIFLY